MIITGPGVVAGTLCACQNPVHFQTPRLGSLSARRFSKACPSRQQTEGAGQCALVARLCPRSVRPGAALPILNIVDDVTRECLAAIPDTSISGNASLRALLAVVIGGPLSFVLVRRYALLKDTNEQWSRNCRLITCASSWTMTGRRRFFGISYQAHLYPSAPSHPRSLP
jgi:hypothetical protein